MFRSNHYEWDGQLRSRPTLGSIVKSVLAKLFARDPLL